MEYLMTEFCHISPTPHLNDFAKDRKTHLVLAHLIEEDDSYTQWYRNEKLSNPSSIVIMDNSAFERFKQNEPMYPSENLIEMGTRVKADYIVMSDYPAEPGRKTIDKAIEMAPELRAAGFGTFFVPQSVVGDLEDLVEGFRWASTAKEVDYIGVSILAVPNAYGVEKGNKLQRFLSRWAFMHRLQHEGILEAIKQNNKMLHMLGMVDGPNEVVLVKDFLPYINTWDSSAAVWAGLNGIAFDNSPSGLINGKFEKEVEFDLHVSDNALIKLAHKNCRYIDMCIEESMRGSDNA
jgi:hypothetical protein